MVYVAVAVCDRLGCFVLLSDLLAGVFAVGCLSFRHVPLASVAACVFAVWLLVAVVFYVLLFTVFVPFLF